MYRNIRLWSYVRSRILIDGASRRQVARQTGVCRNTVKKMLLQPYPQPSAHRCRAIAKDDEHPDKTSDQELPRARRSRAMSLVRLKACRCAYDILRAMDREQGVEFLDVLIGSEVQGPAARGIRQAIYRAVASVSIFRNAVFEFLQEPPSAHGINRTSWKLDDLLQVLNKT